MSHQCVVCHDEEATKRCIQCHKWVGDSCAVTDDKGVFCSRSCAKDYRDYEESKEGGQEEGKRGFVGCLVRKIVGLIVLVVILLAIYVYGARQGWFGENEKARVKSREEQLGGKLEEGTRKLKELQEKAEDKIQR